jgi:uncharacterized membrane-anchored protein YitT (DUF2179 family)
MAGGRGNAGAEYSAPACRHQVGRRVQFFLPHHLHRHRDDRAIDLLKPLLPAIHEGPLIYTLFGGILNGLGVGLILRGQGSAGGTDIIALLLNRHQSIPFGQVYLIANSTVLGLGALVMGLVPALYALIVVFASSLVVNMILEGVGYARAVFIITEQQEALREALCSKSIAA